MKGDEKKLRNISIVALQRLCKEKSGFYILNFSLRGDRPFDTFPSSGECCSVHDHLQWFDGLHRYSHGSIVRKDSSPMRVAVKVVVMTTIVASSIEPLMLLLTTTEGCSRCSDS